MTTTKQNYVGVPKRFDVSKQIKVDQEHYTECCTKNLPFQAVQAASFQIRSSQFPNPKQPVNQADQ